MESNAFFRWIWRLNGLLILLILVFSGVTILIDIYSSTTRGHNPEEVILSVADDPKGEENWVLGYPRGIYGYEYVMLPLVSEKAEVKTQSFALASSGIYDSSITNPSKNLLFVNSQENSSSWLFKDIKQIILRTEQCPHFSDRNAKVDTEVIFYEIVKNDSNNDGVLNSDDKQTLGVSTPIGTDYKVVLESFDKMVTKSYIEKTKQVLLVYQESGIGYSALFDIDTLKIVNRKELPKINNTKD
ncbi:MAG: hypothetical protein ABW098_05400 [Candidatus Thiodiazotropha sp.]